MHVTYPTCPPDRRRPGPPVGLSFLDVMLRSTGLNKPSCQQGQISSTRLRAHSVYHCKLVRWIIRWIWRTTFYTFRILAKMRKVERPRRTVVAPRVMPRRSPYAGDVPRPLVILHSCIIVLLTLLLHHARYSLYSCIIHSTPVLFSRSRTPKTAPSISKTDTGRLPCVGGLAVSVSCRSSLCGVERGWQLVRLCVELKEEGSSRDGDNDSEPSCCARGKD